MLIVIRGLILSLSLLLTFPAYAAEVAREETKSLDEQVQEIKAEVLSIGAEMLQLEEKLLYPSTTQLAVFVSLDNAAKFSLDSMEIHVDGKRVADHLYTAKESEALQNGGVQRIYVGNVLSGQHEVRVSLAGKSAKGAGVRAKENFPFSKDEGPKILELHLADSAPIITLRDW